MFREKWWALLLPPFFFFLSLFLYFYCLVLDVCLGFADTEGVSIPGLLAAPQKNIHTLHAYLIRSEVVMRTCGFESKHAWQRPEWWTLFISTAPLAIPATTTIADRKKRVPSAPYSSLFFGLNVCAWCIFHICSWQRRARQYSRPVWICKQNSFGNRCSRKQFAINKDLRTAAVTAAHNTPYVSCINNIEDVCYEITLSSTHTHNRGEPRYPGSVDGRCKGENNRITQWV